MDFCLQVSDLTKTSMKGMTFDLLVLNCLVICTCHYKLLKDVKEIDVIKTS